MKKLLLLNVLLVSALNGMQPKTPAETIRFHGNEPYLVRHILDTHFYHDDLGAWHDAEHNNLMHLAVGEFIDQRTAADDDQEFQAGYKYLLGYLHQNGVQVNECNDHHQTPIFLLGNRSGDGYRELKEYLEKKLGANPVHVSLQPEVRRAKNIVEAIVSWCSCWGQAAEQHEKID